MPLASLGALLLLLFLLPQGRQAVWRRPEAGQQINTNSREYQAFSCTPLNLFISGNTTKGVQQYSWLQSHLILGTDLFLFLFRSDFLFFFFPLGRGERSSSKEGLQGETGQRGHLLQFSFQWWESQLQQFSRFWGQKLQLLIPIWTFGIRLTYWVSVLKGYL